MKTKTPKILMLFCGGTISMHKNPSSRALEVAHNADQLFIMEPRIRTIADIKIQYIANIDSADMSPRQWEQLTTEIAKHYSTYDGFVITMGTNTMAYCASALSFALQGIGKPVILTGAQIPAESINTDARNNLVNALRVATRDLAGVFVVFGSKIILGCRSKKVSESELDAFKTFNAKDFGEIGVGTLFDHSLPRHSRPLKIKNGFDDAIVCVTLIPGLRAEYLERLLQAGIHGIILRAYGSGDISQNLLTTLTEARRRKVPVVVTTQCPGGATVMGINEVGLKALKTGVIQAFDMSMESMSTKLMWLLRQKTPYKKIKQLMETNFVGEVDSTKAGFILNTEIQ